MSVTSHQTIQPTPPSSLLSHRGISFLSPTRTRKYRAIVACGERRILIGALFQRLIGMLVARAQPLSTEPIPGSLIVRAREGSNTLIPAPGLTGNFCQMM